MLAFKPRSQNGYENNKVFFMPVIFFCPFAPPCYGKVDFLTNQIYCWFKDKNRKLSILLISLISQKNLNRRFKQATAHGIFKSPSRYKLAQRKQYRFQSATLQLIFVFLMFTMHFLTQKTRQTGQIFILISPKNSKPLELREIYQNF